MTGVSIRLTGFDEALGVLHGIGDRLENSAPMWDEIGGYLETRIDERFENERGPDGNPWPKSLRAIVTGGQTLTDSRQLRSSMTHNVLPNGVEAGTNKIYGAIHQFGGVIKAKTSKGLNWKYRGVGANQDSWARKMSVTMPARPFLGLDDTDLIEIPLIVERYIGGADARQ